jgi:hypothetical protein
MKAILRFVVVVSCASTCCTDRSPERLRPASVLARKMNVHQLGIVRRRLGPLLGSNRGTRRYARKLLAEFLRNNFITSLEDVAVLRMGQGGSLLYFVRLRVIWWIVLFVNRERRSTKSHEISRRQMIRPLTQGGSDSPAICDSPETGRPRPAFLPESALSIVD